MFNPVRSHRETDRQTDGHT